mmetsp:Transcript_886/g.1432  ORF Transcript_886/g.1432 Transcript_886/m.1432 type:complete len:238 (-) Transcript_886:2506-3219(-)
MESAMVVRELSRLYVSEEQPLSLPTPQPPRPKIRTANLSHFKMQQCPNSISDLPPPNSKMLGEEIPHRQGEGGRNGGHHRRGRQGMGRNILCHKMVLLPLPTRSVINVVPSVIYPPLPEEELIDAVPSMLENTNRWVIYSAEFIPILPLPLAEMVPLLDNLKSRYFYPVRLRIKFLEIRRINCFRVRRVVMVVITKRLLCLVLLRITSATMERVPLRRKRHSTRLSITTAELFRGLG